MAPDRLAKAARSIAAAQRILTEDQATEVGFEIGFGDGMSWPDGKLALALSDLQLVAFAAAIAAAAEQGGEQQDDF